MQETLEKSDHSEHLSQDYASISSQEQLDFKRQKIVFPTQPPQFSRIYDIYRSTTNNIYKLQQKVNDLQEKILQLQRCKQNSKYDENTLQVLDEPQDESEFMTTYNKKCEQRQKELQSLSEIYSGLKRINTSLNIRKNPKITQLINNYLEAHRKVISYTWLKEHILVLCREIHHKRKNFIININSLNRSVSGGSNKKEKKRNLSRSSKDEAQQLHQQKQENNYSLRMLNTKNLMYTLGEAPVLPLFDSDFTPEQLQAIKLHAQKEVNIMKVVKTPFNKKVQYLYSTYSYDEKCYVLVDQTGKVSLVDNTGEAIDFKMIDKDDKIVLLETRKSDVWVGINDGVLRQYSIVDKKMRLSKVFGCFSKQVQQVNGYILLGEPVDKVLFSIHRGLFQLNINTYEVKQVSQLPDKVLYIVDKYLIMSQQICKLVILKDKYQISRSEALNKWYHQYHPKNQYKRILHIDGSQKEIQVVVGDGKGNINVISI